MFTCSSIGDDEICDDRVPKSIQTLLILPQFQTFGSEAKLEGFVRSH